MSFIRTQQKCNAYERTVYPLELLSADGVSYHKSCFKCSHCKGTLKLSNYSSMEGVLYCKSHFEQFFKETGKFSKNYSITYDFASMANFLVPNTRSPSKAVAMFSGTQDKCATCGKTAYRCSLSPSNYGILYCKSHFSKKKGIKSASMKRPRPLFLILELWLLVLSIYMHLFVEV